MIFLAVLIQHITARFCFIKKTAGTRDLDNRWFTLFVAIYYPCCVHLFQVSNCFTSWQPKHRPLCLKYSILSNRGNLFLLTYLLFPVNVLIGVLLALWRMIITALFNIVHMGRMDISLLNRNVEAFDPGERDVLHSVWMVINTAILSLSNILTTAKHLVKFNVICIKNIS